MSRQITMVISLLILSFSLNAFQSPVEVARVNGESISSGELLYAFNKNRDTNLPVNKDSLTKYLQRYIDFKLKVQEARNAGIDTTKAFQEEYQGYVAQVAKPYLDNPGEEKKLVDEAYQRTLEEVRASHILIRLQPNASPTDSLNAWQKMDSIRNLALNGADFAALAAKFSADGSSRNGGDLGWFTAFGMVYPFESAAYDTPKGEISTILRTQFGYHIVKVTDRRKARGRVKSSHIFVSRQAHSPEEAKALIQKAYDSLQNGGDWRLLCRTYSDDSRTKKNNGALPLAGIGQLPEEYLDIAFSIKERGTYTAPVETSFGWHIVRLDGKQPVPDFDKVSEELKERVKRSGRLQFGKIAALNKIKQKHAYESNRDNVKRVLDSLQSGKGNLNGLVPMADANLFSFAGQQRNVAQFSAFLSQKAGLQSANYNSLLNAVEETELLAYEDSLARIEYPDYGYLLKEYEEGLLLFEIMEEQVWNKAIADSTGMATYFDDNQDKFPAPERAETYLITTKNDSVRTKALELLKKTTVTGQPDSLLKASLSAAEFRLLKIVKRTYTSEDLPNFTPANWAEGVVIDEAGKDRIMLIARILPEGTYSLDEIKGRVTADYQDYLDAAWVAQLRKKSKIKIFKKRIAALSNNE